MKSLIPLLMTPLAASHTISHSHSHHHARSDPDSFFYKPGYITTFLDTFLQTPSGLPSSDNWLIDIGTSYPGGAPRWGNNEFQTYTSSPSNLQISKKEYLTITPALLPNGTWTSARIETQRTDFAAKAGGKLLIESNIRLGNASRETQQGIWPAFWALGESFRGNFTNWPMASEWDFLEVLNGNMTMYSTLHCGTAPGGPCNEYNGISNTATNGAAFSRGEWHVVGFEVDRTMCGFQTRNSTCWESETLRWWLDGEEVFVVGGKDVNDEGAWGKVAHEGHFLLVNVAVGGNWPGAPNNATKGGEGAEMEVDWVGVWNSV